MADEIIARVGPQNYEVMLQKPHTAKFNITGKPMRGWVVVSPDGHEDDDELAAWVRKAVAFALSLPAK